MKCGAIKSKIDIRDYTIDSNVELPEEFQLTGLPAVKNQHDVCSCVAFVASEIAEYFEIKQCKNRDRLSAGYIYGTRYEYTGKGMYLRDALKTLKNKGICKQTRFIYNREVPEIIEKLKQSDITSKDTEHCRITTYFRCRTIEDIKAAIYSKRPVMLAVDWHDDNYFLKNEPFVLYPGEKNVGGHAIFVYGWNKEGLLFQNSWGTSWGNKGRAILSYEYPIKEAWGVSDEYIEPDTRNGILKEIWRIICKMINSILNIILYKD